MSDFDTQPPFYDYEEDTTGKSAEMPSLLNDPWAAVTLQAPPPLEPLGSAASSTPQQQPSGPAPSRRGIAFLDLAGGRFTRGRIAAFVGVVLAVLLIFGGAGIALASMTQRGAKAAPVAVTQGHTATTQQRPTVAPTPVSTPTSVTTATPAPTSSINQTPQPMTITDAFNRTVAPGGWGSAGGLAWQVVSLPAAFSVGNGTGGTITGQGTNQPVFYTALLGSSTTQTVEARCTFALQHFDGGQSNLGLIVRWQGEGHYYKAYLDGSNLVMIKNVRGKHSTLATMPFAAQSGVAYTLRFRSQGSQLSAKAWPTGTMEPAAWMVTATDTSFTSGQTGIRALLGSGNGVAMSLFQVTQQ